ncbi:hypothetical protein EIP86_003439 [Pleurotus ostreatoroseus]|nr:hypothetical protein EIP86_003439 [Pleurotus ostreatoroseus]
MNLILVEFQRLNPRFCLTNTPRKTPLGLILNTDSSHQSTPFPTDPRYPQQSTAYQSAYPARPPSIPPNSNTSRTLPPLGSQGQYYPQGGMPPQTMSGHPSTRSPTASFSSHYNPYEQSQQQLGYYPSTSDPRMHMGMPQIGYPQQPGMQLPRRASMSVDRTVPSRMASHGHGAVPYTRIPPAMGPGYDQEPEVPVKKKRKRADAEQLKVLNETYNRTAFPSTEERIELAKKLGMSARSVQIWFQNKRQAMRQSNRQAANPTPPVTTEPFTATPAPSSVHMAAPSPHSPPGGYGVPSSSASMAGTGYGQRIDGYGRPIPSPAPSQYRGRSYDEPDRRSPSRQR